MEPINWNESPIAPPLPVIPQPKFKVGDIVPNWFLTPHVILGVRLVLSPNSDYDTGWDGVPTWEYNLWKWVKEPRFGSHHYDEWGWDKEDEIIKSMG